MTIEILISAIIRILLLTTTKSARAAAPRSLPTTPTARKPPSHPAHANNAQTPTIPCPSKSAETPECAQDPAVYKANPQDSKESDLLSHADLPTTSPPAAHPPAHH